MGDVLWLECCCGTAHQLPSAVGELVEALGPSIAVQVESRGAWLVPRVWIAAHGLKAADVPALAARHGWPRKEAGGG